MCMRSVGDMLLCGNKRTFTSSLCPEFFSLSTCIFFWGGAHGNNKIAVTHTLPRYKVCLKLDGNR